MKKEKKLSKSASTKGKVEDQSKLAPSFPSDGDRIFVTSEDSARVWSGAYIFREFFEDANRKYEGACIYSEDFVQSQAGTLALVFARVKFWTKWIGETSADYTERQKRIIAEFLNNNPQGDTWGLFWGENAMGENGVHGFFSKPKFGPAFKQESVSDTVTRPNDGELVEVHPRGEVDMRYLPQGIYLESAQRISAVEHLGTYTSKNKRRVERVRYFPPLHPISKWVRFRLLNDDGTPRSEWKKGPCFEEWQKAEQAKFEQEHAEHILKVKKENREHYEARCAAWHEYCGREPNLNLRLVKARKLLGNVKNDLTFNTAVDAEGGGGECYRDDLEGFFRNQIGDLEEALNIQPTRVRNILYEMMIDPEGGTAFEMGLLDRVKRGEQTEEETRQILRELKLKDKRRSSDEQFKEAEKLSRVQNLITNTAKTHESSTGDMVGENGPYTKTVAQLASVASMSESGIRTAIRNKRRVKDVVVYSIRNEGKNSPILISEQSYLKIERKMGTSKMSRTQQS